MSITPEDIDTFLALKLLHEKGIRSNDVKYVSTLKVADELDVVLTQLAQYQLAFQVDDFPSYDYQLQKAKIEAIYKTVVNLQKVLRGGQR